jgi:hypothetical protein
MPFQGSIHLLGNPDERDSTRSSAGGQRCHRFLLQNIDTAAVARHGLSLTSSK